MSYLHQIICTVNLHVIHIDCLFTKTQSAEAHVSGSDIVRSRLCLPAVRQSITSIQMVAVSMILTHCLPPVKLPVFSK